MVETATHNKSKRPKGISLPQADYRRLDARRKRNKRTFGAEIAAMLDELGEPMHLPQIGTK